MIIVCAPAIWVSLLCTISFPDSNWSAHVALIIIKNSNFTCVAFLWFPVKLKTL